jgi:crotonobetainyl-CoA:carnitine CoA-transferase CaiB-like acyl-CoA transferase
MLKTALAFLWPDAMAQETLLGEGIVNSATMASVRYIFPTSDDYIIVSSVSDAEWEALCLAVGRADLIIDPRFARQTARGVNRAAINAEFANVFTQRSTAEWLVILERNDAIFARPNRPEQVPYDPHIERMNALVEFDHPYAGRYRQPRHPIDFDATPADVWRHAPGLGEHSDEILREFGIDPVALADGSLR